VDAYCDRGSCARSVECSDNADCESGEYCVADVGKCYTVAGCRGACDCNPDEVCVPGNLTPYGQQLAEGVRAAVAASEAGLSTRSNFHTLSNHDDFYTTSVADTTFAELVGAWYFDTGDPVKYVSEPPGVLPPDPGPPQCE